MAEHTARRRPQRAWVTWAALACLIAGYWLAIRYLIPWVITGVLL